MNRKYEGRAASVVMQFILQSKYQSFPLELEQIISFHYRFIRNHLT